MASGTLCFTQCSRYYCGQQRDIHQQCTLLLARCEQTSQGTTKAQPVIGGRIIVQPIHAPACLAGAATLASRSMPGVLVHPLSLDSNVIIVGKCVKKQCDALV